jgi:anti-anti-sigma factor
MLLTEYSTLRPYERNRSSMLNQTVQDIVTTERIGKAVIITLGERMDILNAPLVMRTFDALLGEEMTNFVVDLSAVRIVDSDGDYPLLHLLKCVQSVGGSVTLICPDGNPIRLFYEMMRLDTLFDIVTSLEAAYALHNLPSHH